MIYLSIIILCLVTFHIYTKYSRKGRLINKIPGPYAYPFFGNLIEFNVSCMHEMWKINRNISDKYYPITRLWFVKSAMISLRHPDDLEILLTSQKVIEKGYAYDYLQAWFKLGLLTSTGDRWRHRRKMLTPAFHFNILKKYLDIMNVESEKFVNNLKNENLSETVKSLLDITSAYTLNVICESSMGVTLDKMDRKTIDDYKKAVHDFGYVVCYRLSRPYIFEWMLKPFWSIGRMRTKAIKTLHEFTATIIKERRDYHKSTGNKYFTEFEDYEKDNLDLGHKKKLDMLDLLLAAEKNKLIDNDGIQEEVDTFTFEGHDTTGMGLTFTLMLLAENKEAQDTARAEVTEVLKKTDGKLSISDLQDLNYLERCIKESLRLYPPVATIFRYCREDIQLKHALVPAGMDIMVNFMDVHRDPNFWPEPDKFDPDRFLPENSTNRHPFAYVPFSAGPRNCIGQKFAMMELKSVIARILSDFYLEPVDRTADMRLIADIVIRPLDPVHIKFVKIKK